MARLQPRLLQRYPDLDGLSQPPDATLLPQPQPVSRKRPYRKDTFPSIRMVHHRPLTRHPPYRIHPLLESRWRHPRFSGQCLFHLGPLAIFHPAQTKNDTDRSSRRHLRPPLIDKSAVISSKPELSPPGPLPYKQHWLLMPPLPDSQQSNRQYTF